MVTCSLVFKAQVTLTKDHEVCVIRKMVILLLKLRKCSRLSTETLRYEK